MNKQHKIQAALDAVAMATPGDWLVDDFNDLKDGVGEFPIARDVGGTTGTQEAANRKVIAASRELAEEVVELRSMLATAGVIVSGLVDRKDVSGLIAAMGEKCKAHNVPQLSLQDLFLASATK